MMKRWLFLGTPEPWSEDGRKLPGLAIRDLEVKWVKPGKIQVMCASPVLLGYTPENPYYREGCRSASQFDRI